MALTLDGLISQWASLHLAHRRPRYAAEAQRAIRQAFAEYLERPAGRLSRSDAVGVLDAMAHNGKAISAGRTMAYARACYAWAEKNAGRCLSTRSEISPYRPWSVNVSACLAMMNCAKYG